MGVNTVVRGIYHAANALITTQGVADIISDNLAGLNLPGYPRAVPAVAREDWFAQWVSGSALTVRAHLDPLPGPLRHTGQPLDLALEGPGYFCVQTPAGLAYTRGGAFRLDPTGRLITPAGYPVLGDRGPIHLTGRSFEVREDGEVVVDGTTVGRLRLAQLPPEARPVRLAGSLLRPTDPAQVIPASSRETRVRQGYLEGPNVNPLVEMAALVAALRAFEASQRALQATDESLDRLINGLAQP